MTGERGFSVLLAKPELPPLDKIAEILARFVQGPLFDARQKAKNAWGFLGEKLSDAEAARLAALAAEAGFETRVLPADRLAALPSPVPVHWLRATPEALFYTTGSTSDEKSYAWDRVRLLAAAGLKEQITITKTVKEGPSPQERAVKIGLSLAGIPMGFGGAKEVKKTVQETELFLHLDVFVDGDEGPARLHVNAQQFNYAVLGEARTTNTFGNFRMLLQSLDRFAGSAFRNKGARGILSGQPLSQSGYEGHVGYEKEILWLLSLLCP